MPHIAEFQKCKLFYRLGKLLYTYSKKHYNVDGLIFYPHVETYRRGVTYNMNKSGKRNGRLATLKWKPYIENTIDFLMKKKEKNLIIQLNQ